MRRRRSQISRGLQVLGEVLAVLSSFLIVAELLLLLARGPADSSSLDQEHYSSKRQTYSNKNGGHS